MATPQDHLTIESFMSALSPLSGDEESMWRQQPAFRGVSDSRHRLIPSALRSFDGPGRRSLEWLRAMAGNAGAEPSTVASQRFNEFRLLVRFADIADRVGNPLPGLPDPIRRALEGSLHHQDADDGPWLPDDLLDLAALAQHYGIPTRLLDWSYDPLIAMYFAATGGVDRILTGDPTGSISVWALLTFGLEHCFPQIRLVKPPYGGNPNLAAQRGLFTHWLHDADDDEPSASLARPLDDLLRDAGPARGWDASARLVEHRLPIEAAPELVLRLERAGYGAERCFPGYGGAARAMHEIAGANLARSRLEAWPA